MRSMEKKAGLILGGIFLFSLVLVGVVMAVVTDVQDTGATVTVNEFISITLSDPGSNGVVFGAVNPGTNDNPDAGQSTGTTTAAVTVTNEAVSNVEVNVDVKGTNLVSVSENSKFIPVGQVTYDDDGDPGQTFGVNETAPNAETTLATTYGSSYHAGVAPSSSVGFWFFLDVPTGQAAKSDYEGIFSFQSKS